MPTSIPRPPANGVYIFDTPDQMIEALFGPAQHDAHVVARRRWKWLEDRRATPEKIAAFEAYLDQQAQRRQAERAS